MVIALSIASWFTAARIVRGQIITLKENDYVRAAHAVGARWHRILVRHLLPNTLGVLIIAIFLELPGRHPRRGVPLVHRPRRSTRRTPRGARWRRTAATPTASTRTCIIIPASRSPLLVICANFIADGMRDALDPRTRET